MSDDKITKPEVTKAMSSARQQLLRDAGFVSIVNEMEKNIEEIKKLAQVIVDITAPKEKIVNHN